MAAFPMAEDGPPKVGDRFSKTGYKPRPWWQFWRRTPREVTRTFVVTHVSDDGKFAYERVAS